MQLKSKLLYCILAFYLFLVLISCSAKKERTIHRSFYYWKSSFKLTAAEKSALTNLHIENLYVKFFDVAWNVERNRPMPIAQVNFIEKPPASILITPVVFITNETLQKIAIGHIDTLANNLAKLLTGLLGQNNLQASTEIQIDCDWTAGTKEKYFNLLRLLKKNVVFENKKLSVTVRLHQLKYISENGIPPADKALLMCYNMGNLRREETDNSIIDPNELKKYIALLQHYPLNLDVALPVFDWWVWFRQHQYKGLIHADDFDLKVPASKKILFDSDTLLNGYTFEKGDWLRYEDSPAASNQRIARLLYHKLQSDTMQVILYHLDEKNLSKYKPHELESFFDSFR